MWAHQRTLRIADGPDEVHLNQLGKTENKKFAELYVIPSFYYIYLDANNRTGRRHRPRGWRARRS
jgi:hypothetical protein